MKPIRKTIRFIAAFLIVNTLYFTFLPGISYASLTAGPNAPEATSFEPIDTTDMVNLISGDFTYNLPLLEVPGPAGGYPLGLSYHAGIMTNEEASWVGLGWTLNPGAITRDVNGYADDHKNALETNRFYWQGGEQHQVDIGATLGVAGVVGPSAGLSLGHDTYQGFGVGAFAGIAAKIAGEDSGSGANATFGISPFGGPYASVGLSIGLPGGGENSALNVGVGIGVSTNFKSIGAGGGVSTSVDYGKTKSDVDRGSASLLGASMSTGSNGFHSSVSVGGTSSHNQKAGKISTSSFSFTLPIPFVNLGYKYTRYWIDETTNTKLNGVFHNPNMADGSIFYDETAFDSYSLLDPSLDGGIVDNPDPDKLLGGSFPNNDNYNVNAQGVSGNMRPYVYQGYIARKHKFDENGSKVYQVKNLELGRNLQKPFFRFIKEFSNTYQQESNTDIANFSTYTYNTKSPGQSLYGFNSPDFNGQSEGHFISEFAGTKHIEYFTNEEILDTSNQNAKSKGFIDTNSAGFVRDNNEQIGGYKITNETGVTYHFALPVYSYDEFQYSENITKEDGDTYNSLKKDEKYAHTWYLTTITGPDFVDVNNDGLANDGDWGYWVEFEYGLWSDQYTWRNPGEGSHEDLDENFENFSEGTKEVYYLDAIKTQTHTALFVKDLRDDAKSAIKTLRDIFTSGGQVYAETVTEENKEGGYFPEFLTHNNRTNIFSLEQTKYYAKPVSSLKLKKIILLNNESLQSVAIDKSIGNNYNQSIKYSQYNSDESFKSENEVIQHLPDNVLDIHDIDQTLIDKAQRVIEFDSDNEGLVPGTTNSFSYAHVFADVPITDPSFYESNLKSKLTLNSVQFSGKNGISLTPPINFKYNKNPSYDKDAYDMWNMYKPDYTDTDSDAIDRIVTPASAVQVDAWSLTEIETPVGSTIKIEYEADSYNESVLMKNFGHILGTPPIITNLSNNEIELTIGNASNLELYLSPEDSIDALIGYHIKREHHSSNEFSYLTPKSYRSKHKIIAVANNVITISSPELVNIMNYSEYFGNILFPYTDTYEFTAGNISLENVEKFGGGIKVRAISVENPINTTISKTEYDYSFNGLTSGITPYEPTSLNSVHTFFDPDGLFHPDVNLEDAYKKELYKPFSDLLANSREVPAPGVMYEYVTTKNSVIKNGTERFSPSYSRYHFEVFKESMIGYQEMFSDEYNDSGTIAGETISGRKKRAVTKKDFTARIGTLKSMTLYDNNNNPISSTINHYLHDDATIDRITDNDLNIEDEFEANIDVYETDISDRFFSQGVIEEAFADARIVRDEDSNQSFIVGVVSKREEYPSIQTGQTNINYKTGITTTSKNLDFDFYSGAVTKSFYSDGYGNNYITENIPAYRYNSYGFVTYPGMGLAINGGKNMLAQEAASFTYKVDNENNQNRQALVNGSVQLWKEKWSYRELISSDYQLSDSEADAHPVWRKYKSYTFIGDDQIALTEDGLYPYTAIYHPIGDVLGGFDVDTRWQKNSEITLYDRNSHALEAMDVNGNYAATKMDLDNSKVYTSTANARYTEFAYSGAEDGDIGNYFGGEVKRIGYLETDSAHTGMNSVLSNSKAFSFTAKATRPITFRTSFWCNQNDAKIKYQVNDGLIITPPLKTIRQADNWYLIEAVLPAVSANDEVEIWCEAASQGREDYFDDFRVHPIDAPMTAYVYDQATDELTHILDNNNLYTKYEYDAMGRLTNTYKESFKYGVKKVSEVEYNYGRTYYDDL